MRVSALLIGLAMAALSSCSNAGADSEGPLLSVRFGESVNTPFRMSQLVDTVSYIQLDSAYTIGVVSEMKMVGGRFYICDRHESKIYVVDSKGRVTQCLSNKGRARQEYYATSDFDVDPLTEDIHVWDAVAHRFLVYSKEGTYKGDVPYDGVVRDFAVMGKGDYLMYTPDDNGRTARRGLWLTDSHGKFRRQLVEIDKDFKYGGIYPNYLVRLGNDGIGLMDGEDKDNIYRVSGDSAEVEFHIDFGMKIPEKIARRTLVDFNNYKGKIYTKNNYFENRRWLLFNSTDMNNMAMSIYDKKERRYYQLSGPEDLRQDVKVHGEPMFMNDSVYVCVVYPGADPAALSRMGVPVRPGNKTNPILVIAKLKR